jgi:NAD-dependent dihydropyrimidine dehydrogenase PreA subunit
MTFRWPQSPARMSTDDFMEWLETATPEQLERFAADADGMFAVLPPPVVISEVVISEAAFKRLQARKDEPPEVIDESDCFDCGLSQEEARDELQRIERSLINEDAVADALEFMDEYGEVFKGLAD